MIAQRYQLESEIRRGAFGAIYKGIYEKTGESVAIKIDHSPRPTLKHEIRIVQYLSQAGVKKIPQIYWFGLYNDKPCVVMTLFECSLYDYRQKGRTQDSVHLYKTMWLLLDILENVHRGWVVHRDMKPHNFMIKGGELYLIDFGLATFYMNEKGEHTPDQGSTTMMGSPYFASLRIHEGHTYSRRDDLISLGYIGLYMQGVQWTVQKGEDGGSPLDLNYSANRNLQCQKENLVVDDSPLRQYMTYVYSLDYEETPKYLAMKQMFIP
jgi:serine/threonine protein kinase